jgi:hypothetical protein
MKIFFVIIAILLLCSCTTEMWDSLVKPSNPDGVTLLCVWHWDFDHSYFQGDMCSMGHENGQDILWISLQNGNQGNRPWGYIVGDGLGWREMSPKWWETK